MTAKEESPADNKSAGSSFMPFILASNEQELCSLVWGGAHKACVVHIYDNIDVPLLVERHLTFTC